MSDTVCQKERARGSRGVTENSPLAFIVGSGRSGTTLLAAALNRHPKISVPAETHFFTRLRLFGGWSRVSRNSEELDAFLRDMIKLAELPCTPADILSQCRSSSPSCRELFNALMASLVGGHGKPFCIEKTPSHLFSAKYIREVFPEAKLIVTIRDGRDVAKSYTRMPWAPDSYVDNLLTWRACVEEGDAILVNRDTILVKFENLVRVPEAELEKLCDFLGVAFSPSLLTPDGSETQLYTPRQKWKEKVSGAFDAAEVEKWRRELSALEGVLAMSVAHDTLKTHGFSVEGVKRKPHLCRPRLGIAPAVLREDPVLWDSVCSGLALRGWDIEAYGGRGRESSYDAVISGTVQSIVMDFFRANNGGLRWFRGALRLFAYL